jgi:hypothetical protein
MLRAGLYAETGTTVLSRSTVQQGVFAPPYVTLTTLAYAEHILGRLDELVTQLANISETAINLTPHPALQFRLFRRREGAV